MTYGRGMERSSRENLSLSRTCHNNLISAYSGENEPFLPACWSACFVLPDRQAAAAPTQSISVCNSSFYVGLLLFPSASVYLTVIQRSASNLHLGWQQELWFSLSVNNCRPVELRNVNLILSSYSRSRVKAAFQITAENDAHFEYKLRLSLAKCLFQYKVNKDTLYCVPDKSIQTLASFIKQQIVY